MSHDHEELIKIFAGPLMEVELQHAALADAGIESKVVGTELAIGLGTAFNNSTELWIREGDLAKAEDVIRNRQKPHQEREKFPHPTDDPKPAAPHTHKQPHVNPDPRS